VIGSRGDRDVFAVWALPSNLTVRLDILDSPPSPNYSSGDGWSVSGSNLNAAISVQYPDDSVVRWSSDAALLWGTWSVPTTVQGYHYITVEGVGLGANGSVGFSNYGQWKALRTVCCADEVPQTSTALSALPSSAV